MSRTYRRQKYFDSKRYIDNWFEDTEHDPFEIPSWASSPTKKRLENYKVFKNHVHSESYSLTDRCQNFVKTQSNKIVRSQKRKILINIKKDIFSDTPKCDNKKNNLYMMYIY